MIRTVITMTALLLLSPLAGAAQTDAANVLGRLSEKIASLGNYRVAFSAAVEGRSVEGSYVVSADRYHMNTAEVEVISDGKSRWEVNHVDREVLVDKVNTADRNILSNPTRAFDFAADSFKASYAGTAVVNGRLCDRVSLQPLAKGSSINDITIAVARDNGLPAELRYAADGLDGEIVVAVKSFAADSAVKDAAFKFVRSKYSDYELVDFR